MFFGRATSGFSALFSTHPPLAARIRVIEPSWDGTFPTMAPDADLAIAPLRDAEGPGYDEKTMNVGTAQGKETAIVYIANDIVSGLRPYDWYKAFVVAGAKEHGLPAEYVEWLKKFQSQPDTDEARRAREEAILGGE